MRLHRFTLKQYLGSWVNGLDWLIVSISFALRAKWLLETFFKLFIIGLGMYGASQILPLLNQIPWPAFQEILVKELILLVCTLATLAACAQSYAQVEWLSAGPGFSLPVTIGDFFWGATSALVVTMVSLPLYPFFTLG